MARPTSAARCGSSGPSFLILSARERPSTSSITIHGRLSSLTTSKTVTALPLRILAMALASRKVRVMSRCFSSSSTLEGKRSSFTATRRQDFVLAAPDSTHTAAPEDLPEPIAPAYQPSRVLAHESPCVPSA